MNVNKTGVKILQDAAEDLASRILTVHTPEGDVECTRAQLMIGDGSGSGVEKNMGGRGKASIARVIYEWLTE